MGSNQKQKLQAVRSPNQTIASPRGADEHRRVAEIVRDIEELGFRLAKPHAAATHGVSEDVFPKATKFRTFSAAYQQGNSAKEEGAATWRRVWRPSLGAVTIGLFLVSSWAVVLMGPQHAYRSATTEMHRLISFVMDPLNEIAQDAYRIARNKITGLIATQEKAQAQEVDRMPAEDGAQAEGVDREGIANPTALSGVHVK